MAGTGHDDLKLDSAYFVALEMGHGTLKHALMEASDLNITQYRILVKVYAVSPEPIAPMNLSKLLRLKANVVTQATDTLEEKGLVQRRRSDQDARMRMLSVTDAGLKMIDHVNQALVERLYAEWPTENPLYRTSLEACIIAGAAIEPPASDKIRQFPASRTLVSFELIRQTVEAAMRAAIDAPYNDCRIVQRLYEASTPLRAVDLSHQLMLPAVTITRATSRLVDRGWVQRFSSPDNRRAVFVAATDAGMQVAAELDRVIDRVAYECFWSKLDADHRHALCQVGGIVMEDRRKREEEAVLGRLQRLV